MSTARVLKAMTFDGGGASRVGGRLEAHFENVLQKADCLRPLANLTFDTGIDSKGHELPEPFMQGNRPCFRIYTQVLEPGSK